MNRLSATRRLMKHVTNELVVASLGNPTYDLFAACDRPENFYTWGGMGMASSIGLGLALARPDRGVIVLDGDGSLLMNLGSLGTIATKSPPNLIHVVWDNEQYQLTGGQATATKRAVVLAHVASGAGIEQSHQVKDEEELEERFRLALASPGPWFFVAKVDSDRGTSRPPRDPIRLKYRFMEAIKS